MKKANQIMEVTLPNAAAADVVVRAAQSGIDTREFLGIHVLAGLYGHLHPLVVEFKKRANLGISGPETQEGETNV